MSKEVTFTECKQVFDQPLVGKYHLFFHFRNGWAGFWEKNSTEELTNDEQSLVNRILATINNRWECGCNSDLQLFLQNLRPTFQNDEQWYSIVASENHNVVVQFGRDFGNIDYPVTVSVYR